MCVVGAGLTALAKKSASASGIGFCFSRHHALDKLYLSTSQNSGNTPIDSPFVMFPYELPGGDQHKSVNGLLKHSARLLDALLSLSLSLSLPQFLIFGFPSGYPARNL